MNPMVENAQDYFRQWLPNRSDLLIHLEKEAQQKEIPIVGPVVGRLLYLLARLINARKILELGGATGYSTIFLAEACRHNQGRVISLEMNEDLANQARANLAKAALSDFADIICDNALSAVETMTPPFDMAFLDIEKVDYATVLPSCERLLRPGGMLFADNTGFRDADRFNQAVHESGQWESVNLWSFLPGHSPENDGICIAMKR